MGEDGGEKGLVGGQQAGVVKEILGEKGRKQGSTWPPAEGEGVWQGWQG